MIEFSAPYPPSLNTYYRTYQGRIILSVKARAYLKDFGYTLYGASGCKLKSKEMPFTCDLEVVINVFPPDKRRRDLDNLLKCLLDTMQKCDIYKDDSQISKLKIIRNEIIKNGKVDILIKECSM